MWNYFSQTTGEFSHGCHLMPRSDYKVFSSVKIFTVSEKAIKESLILAMSRLRDMTDYMLIPDQPSFAVHAMTLTTDKSSREVNKKLNMLVCLS